MLSFLFMVLWLRKGWIFTNTKTEHYIIPFRYINSRKRITSDIHTATCILKVQASWHWVWNYTIGQAPEQLKPWFVQLICWLNELSAHQNPCHEYIPKKGVTNIRIAILYEQYSYIIQLLICNFQFVLNFFNKWLQPEYYTVNITFLEKKLCFDITYYINTLHWCGINIILLIPQQY